MNDESGILAAGVPTGAPGGLSSRGVATADFDSDGYQDFITVTGDSNTQNFEFKGDGTADTFSQVIGSQLSAVPNGLSFDIAVVDIDNDGDTDVLVSNAGRAQLFVWRHCPELGFAQLGPESVAKSWCFKCPETSTQYPLPDGCYFCPAGKTVVAGTRGLVGEEFCVACPAGKFREENGAACEQCPMGKMTGGGGAPCTSCPTATSIVGSMTIGPETFPASRCFGCSPGQEPNPDRTCEPACDADATTNSGTSMPEGCQTCGPADSPTWSAYGVQCETCTEPNVVNDAKTQCTAPFVCAAGTHCSSGDCADQMACVQCDVGYAGIEGICDDCSSEQGKVANQLQTACEACVPGTMPASDQSICEDCLDSPPQYSQFGIECLVCAALVTTITTALSLQTD